MSTKPGAGQFGKGDLAKELFLTATGRFLVAEMGEELLSGRFFGEIGFFAPELQLTWSMQRLAITHKKQQPSQGNEAAQDAPS